MSDLIATDRQLLEQDAIVQMFELDARKFGDGILRFSNSSVDGQPISFNGYVYQPLPIKAEGFTWKGNGPMPRPTLTLAAKDLVFLSLVINADDLIGCPVTRIRTYRKYLDDGKTPNPEAMFLPDNYVIERKVLQKRRQIQFELSAPMDQQGRMIPNRQVLRDSCTHRFRFWANGRWNYDGVTCPYTGSAMFKVNGESTSDPSQAKCGKRISDCKRHFGDNAVLPFYGFPGVDRF
ncbi:MAG: phage minor tail protein L [Pseudomonas balearica]|jgi:lambda family phage minor tail protein L|nr:phage minor tail protein L [Stutzerimonas balearica]